MKAVKTLLIICLILTVSTIKSQNAEQYINSVVNEINNKIEEVHQLASQKKMYKCIDKLDEVYFKLNSERRKGTFDEEYKKAKRNNPSFTYTIRQDLPKQLQDIYWKSKLEQCKRILANQDVVIKGMIAARRLNNEDKFIALVKQLKTGYDAISGIIENTATFNPIKMGYDLHGNFNDAIENYKSYEAADLKNLELDERMAKFNLTIKKAEKNKYNFNFFQKYLKDNYDAVTDFKVNVDYLNRIKNTIDSGPIDKLDFTSYKYNWNYGPFQKEVEELCKYFNPTNDYCEDFKKSYNEINIEARSSLDKVIKNIEISDDHKNKQKFVNENNARWTEYKNVVNPKFNRVYNQHCGANAKPKTQNTNSNTSTTDDRNVRKLNIQSLEIDNSSGSNASSFEAKQEVRVDFELKWDGQWLDRVKMRLLIDNELILDEMLAFRNNMGDFQTEFVKRVRIPAHLSEGSHQLSIQFARDPKILNKSIQLQCAPKTISFQIGSTNKAKNEEAVPDYNNLFAGSKVKKKVVAEKKPEKKVVPKITSSDNKIIDKYWEIQIPEDAEREWMINDNNEYEVRYQVNGRTVGFKKYKDSNFNLPVIDEIMNNIAIKHGPNRRFTYYSNDPHNILLSNLSFYRVNKKTGPEVVFEKDGGVRQIKYFIDNVELSEAEYKQKAKSDKSLAPYDIYKQSKWKELPTESNMPDPPEISNTDKLGFHQLTIPSQAVKFIRASYSKSSNRISYHEYYFLPNNTSENVGRRAWFISGSNAIIYEESVNIGRKGISRSWNPRTGELTHLSFRNRDKIIEGISRDAIYVGPFINKGEVTFRRFNGEKCTRNEYISERVKYPQLPDPDIVDLLMNSPNISPNAHPDPKWVNQDVTSMSMPHGSEIWRINIGSGVSVQYFHNHAPVFYNAWHDREMTNPSSKIIESYYNKILSVSWYTNGKPQHVNIKGRVENKYIMCDFNEDGSIKRYSLGGRTGNNIEVVRHAYQGFINIPSENTHLSPNLKSNMNPPQIPQAEMTPMFKKLWGKENIETSAPSFESISEQNQFENTQTENLDSKEEDNYQQLQRQEFFTLAAEVQKIIDKADKSFNKKYWNDPGSSRVTINETNPKQEAYDILRRALPIIKRAKYPENEASINHLLAMKYSEYSGRVFGFKAKQDFFLEATKLINRSDQLIPQLKHIKSKSELSEFYCLSAEVWREMTRKAQWGDHAYNKMACDKKVTQQYERAVQTDPNNQKAKRILENLKAPKKAIPAAVAKFEKIPDEIMNKAQQEMFRLDKEKTWKELNKKPEINPLEVAEMTLSHSSGTVSIKRSGAKSWEKVTDSHVLLFNRDKIKTSEDASGVSITYTSDQTFLAIKNSAEVEIVDEYSLVIRRGGGCIQVHKKGSKFLVITPTALTGVRGTQFEVKVADDKSTETFLYEGVVEIRNANDIGYLIPGQKMTAKKGETKLVQSSFNAQQRLSTQWRGFEQQQRKHKQIVADNKSSQPNKKAIPKNKNKTTTKPKNNNNNTFKNNSFAELWSLNTYNNNIESFKQNVTTKTNKGFVPVGLNCAGSQYEVLYLGGGVLSISAWNMEWYNDANSLQQGINKNMNQGYIPSGFSWNGNAYYVFYIKTNFIGKAWQIVPSSLDLKAVSNALEPFVDKQYVPMGITIFGDEYYTLLVQFETPLANNWFIEGYNDKRSEIVKNINKRLPDGTVPWGILKSGGVANILYVGM